MQDFYVNQSHDKIFKLRNITLFVTFN